MKRIRKRGLFLILFFSALALFSAYKAPRIYARMLLKKEVEPHKTTISSEYCFAKRYFTLKQKLEPLSSKLARFMPEVAGRAGYRVSNDYVMSKITTPFDLESFAPDDWRVGVIDEALATFKGRHFTSRDFERFLVEVSKEEDWEHRYLFGLFKIHDGQLYIKDFTRQHPWFKEVSLALLRLVEHTSLPNMEFIVSMHDSLEHDSLELDPRVIKHAPVPIFVFSKKKTSGHLIALPDHEMLSGYKDLEELVSDEKRVPVWKDKEETAFWRGATTSGDYAQDDWGVFPRSKLIKASLEASDGLIDAKFSFLTDSALSNAAFCAYCDMYGATSSFVKVEGHLGFKYLIDIDGNASTYSRFYWILRSNCLPVKVTSSFTQWYYPGLEPYVHYLEVSEDLSDLESQLLWAKAHDKEAKQIADQGATFAQRYLSDSAIYSYLYHLLSRYSTLYVD